MASNGFSTMGGSSSQRQDGKPSLSTLVYGATSLVRNNDSDLPQIRYGIEEIERLSEGVAARSKRARNGDGLQLLSSIGVNASQLNQSINNLPSDEAGTKRRRGKGRAGRPDALPDIGPSYSVGDGDVAAWGRNWHETIILSGIEFQRQRTVKAFNDQFQRRSLENWEADKARIMQDELGVTDEEVRSVTAGLGASTLGRSALGGSVRKYPSGPSSGASKEGDLAMHTKQTRYNEVVSQLNKARLNKQPFELAQAFEEVARTDASQPQLRTTFRILAHMMHEPALADEQSAPVVRERQYAQTYSNEVDWRGQKGAALRGRLVSGAKRFLEKDFESHMDEIISKKPKAAALGGLPGFENKARAFVNALFKTEDHSGFTELKTKFNVEVLNELFLYAQVYFLLRAGHYEDAIDCLTTKSHTLPSSDSHLPAALKAWVENNQHLPEQHRIELRKTWDLDIRNKDNVDQFRVALYKIIGRIDMAKKGVKVATSTEDWVWVNLMLTREGLEDSPVDKYTLKDFATVVAGLPRERYDSKGTRPLVWVNLLLQAGEFEEAVAYLYDKAQSRTDAVHLAVVLQYYGLLRLADPNDTILSYEDSGPTCNFARIVRNYISPIARVEPASALQYAYLVAMGGEGLSEESKRKEQSDLAIGLVQEVVLASRAWSKLLGTVRADGSKQPGLIEQHFPLLNLPSTTDFFRRIVLQSAEQSALDSSLIDSIELYHLANAPDKVIETVNRALGASLSLPNANTNVSSGNDLGISGAFGGVSDLYSLAKRVREVYERDLPRRGKIPQGAWETLGVLISLKLGLAQFAEGRADLALETFKSTGILPLDPDPTTVPPAKKAFKSLLDQPTISSLDEIVIVSMKCLHALYTTCKESPYGDQGRMGQMEVLRGAARSLVLFGGGMRLRLGGDVYRQLSSLSGFLQRERVVGGAFF